MMKTLRYMTALCALLLLAACGGGSDGGGGTDPTPTPTPTPKTYSQELTLTSDAREQVVTLSDFNASISSISGTTPWFQMTKEAYASGAPSVKMIVAENLTTTERKCNVTLTASTGDKLILNVTQAAHAEETRTGADDTHDNVTDQPAYAPLR